MKIPSLGDTDQSILSSQGPNKLKYSFIRIHPREQMSLLNFLAVYGPGVTGRSLGGPKEDSKVFIQHGGFPIPHMEAPLQLTFTSLCSLNSSHDPQGMCSCGRIAGRWLGSPTGFSDESPVTLPWPPSLRECHPSTNQMVNDGLLQASTPALMKTQGVLLR